MNKLMIASVALCCAILAGCGENPREALKSDIRSAMQHFGYSDQEINEGIGVYYADVDSLEEMFLDSASLSMKFGVEKIKGLQLPDDKKAIIMDIGRRAFKPGASEVPRDIADLAGGNKVNRILTLVEVVGLLKEGDNEYCGVFPKLKKVEELRKTCQARSKKIAELIGFDYWSTEDMKSGTKNHLEAIAKEINTVEDLLKDSGLKPGMMAKAAKFTNQFAGLDVRESFRDLIGKYLKNPNSPGIKGVTELGLKQVVDAVSSALAQVEREEAQKDEGINHAISEFLDNELILPLRFKGYSEKNCNDLKRTLMEELKSVPVDGRIEAARKKMAETIRKYDL